MARRAFTRALPLLLIAWTISDASAQSFTLLGTLPGGTNSYANAVSGDGLVVVGHADTLVYISYPGNVIQDYHSIRWTMESGTVDISPWPQVHSQAYSVNADGTVAAGTGGTLAAPGATLWSRCAGTQVVSPYVAGYANIGYGVSRDGRVVAGTSGGYAFRWTNAEGVQNLGTLLGPPNGGHSEGWGLSGDGLVVVGRSDWTNHTRAFRWTSTTGMVNLGTLGPEWNEGSQAMAVNYDGSVVVGSSGSRAFRWTAAGGMQDLGTLPGGTSSTAFGVNADGTIVVGESNAAGGGTYAFLWTAEGGMVNLAEHLHSLGLAVGLWPDRGTGVSDDGLTVVGRVRLGGHDEGWVAMLGVGPRSPGACCRGAICTALVSTECTGVGSLFTGPGVACNVVGDPATPCCKADFNKAGGITIVDIFDFLDAWFAQSPAARFSSQCAVHVADILDFLSAWFAGC